MSFLKLNGLTIPIAGGGMVPKEIGSRGVAFDGTPLGSRRALKRHWSYTTPPMSEAEYNLVEAVLQKKGQVWFHESEDEYSTKGVGPLSGTAYGGEFTRELGEVGEDPVYDQNGEPDAKSVVAGSFSQAYTNDVSANIATGGDTNGDTTGFTVLGAGSRSYSTAKAWKGAGSIRVNPSGASMGVVITPTTLTLATNYLTTLYVLPTTNTTLRVRYRDNDMTPTESWQDTSVTADEWVRIVVVDQLSAGTSPRIDIATLDGNSFYIDGVFTVDSWADYAIPPWAEASIVANTMEVAPSIVTSAHDLTIAFWTKMDWTDTNRSLGYFMAMQPASGSSVFFIARNANNDDLVAYGPSGTSFTVDPVFDDAEWHHIAVVMRSAPESGAKGGEIWVDGVLEDSSASATTIDWSTITNIYLGGLSTTDWLGVVDDLIIVPAALNSEMITALQTTPWAGLPKLRATGDFVYQDSVEVVPRVLQAPYRPSMRGGTFAPNSRSLSFELHEV